MQKLITLHFLLFLLITLCAQSPQLILPIGHTSVLTDAQFSHDGKRVITTSYDKIVKIWDVQFGKLLANLKGHNETIIMTKYSPDDK